MVRATSSRWQVGIKNNEAKYIPTRKKSWFSLLMQSIKDGDLPFPCRFHKGLEMGDCVCMSERGGDHEVKFPRWVQEVVVGVYQDNGCVWWWRHDECIE